MKSSLSLLAATAFLAGCGHMHHESDGTPLVISQVPIPVRETLKRESGGADISSVDQEEHHGMVCYEADAMINGKNYEIKVAPDGTLISKRLDDERE